MINAITSWIFGDIENLDPQRNRTMLKNKLTNLYEWIYADTTPGLRLLSVTLVVWLAIFLTANTIAYFVG